MAFGAKRVERTGRRPDWWSALVLRRGPAWLARLVGRRRRAGWRPRLTLALAALGLAVGGVAARFEPQRTIEVDGWTVYPGADGLCALVEAIHNANDTANGRPYSDCAPGNPAGADVINLTEGAYYRLNKSLSSGDVGPNGLPWISSEITINGRGATIWRDASYEQFRVLAVGRRGNLHLNDIALMGGELDYYNEYGGSGILNQGQLTLTNSRVITNFSGGIRSGTAADPATLAIRDSAIGGNGDFGVIVDHGSAFISGSTIEGHPYSGGISIHVAEVTIINTTITNNRDPYGGGGITLNGGLLTVAGSTITRNKGYYTGGGLEVLNGGNAYLYNTIISGNETVASSSWGDEVYASGGTVYSGGFNVFGHAGVTHSQAFYGFAPSGSDLNATSYGQAVPLTSIVSGTLQNNGGPTQTLALPSDSPAIDFAPNGYCEGWPLYGVDQRGYGRNANGRGTITGRECDAGAFEFAAQADPTDTPTPTVTATHTPTRTPTATIHPTITRTPTPTPSRTPTRTPTMTRTPTPTTTATPTRTIRPTITWTPTTTVTPTPTITPTPTATTTRRPDTGDGVLLPAVLFLQPYLWPLNEVEPNDDPGQDNGPLVPGREYVALPDDYLDRFYFQLPAPGRMVVELTDHRAGVATLGLLHEVDGVRHRIALDATAPFRIEWDSPLAETFYVEVTTDGETSVTLPYRLVARFGE